MVRYALYLRQPFNNGIFEMSALAGHVLSWRVKRGAPLQEGTQVLDVFALEK